MAREFAQFGIRIQYPDKWTVETEDTEDGWSVSIISPDTAFLMISNYSNDFTPEELADMALAAMRESYTELETDSVVDTLAGLPAVGYDVEFVALDLTNTCQIRALAGPEGKLLLMSQCTDHELDGNGEAMRSMCESLQFQDGD
jgi:hypothetical protein